MDCCTGQTECTLVVTIGYLKSLINGKIKNTSGGNVTVNAHGHPDDYALSYSELTGGTYVPVFVDGGTNKWASNIDGIKVNGTYDGGDEIVKQTDLEIIYTRYNSLSVSAVKTTFDGCGDNTTLSYTLYFTKYSEKMNNSCATARTSSTSADTSNTGAGKVTYASNNNWLSISGSRVSAGKNGYSSRTGSVYGYITYKGQNYDSSNVSITQNAISGGYTEYGGRTITGIDAYASGSTSFDCAGGNYGATSIVSYYDTYYWKDSCGDVDYSDYNTTSGTFDGPTKTGTFSEHLCPTQGDFSNQVTLTLEYGGYSDSVTFYQSCVVSGCPDCEDWREWSTVEITDTADYCGDYKTYTRDVPYTDHHKEYVDGECVETSTTPGTVRTTIYVSIPANNTSSGKTFEATESHIHYIITQAAGPCQCLDAVTSYSYAPVYVGCNSAATSAVQVSYTATTTYSNCDPEYNYGSSGRTLYNVPCYSGSTDRNLPGYNFTVIQRAGGCTCTSCTPTTSYTYAVGRVGCEEKASSSITVGATATTTDANCRQTTSAGTKTFTITNIPCNDGAERDLPGYPSQDVPITVRQDGGCTCTCLNPRTTYTYGTATIPCSAVAETSVTVTYTATTTYDNCPQETSTGNKTINIYNVECNSGASRTLTVSGVTITQLGGCTCTTCSCGGVEVRKALMPQGTAENNYPIITYTITDDADCPITITSVTSSENWLTIDSYNDGVITASFGLNSAERQTTVTISYTKGDVNCSSNIEITQPYYTSCEDTGINMPCQRTIQAVKDGMQHEVAFPSGINAALEFIGQTQYGLTVSVDNLNKKIKYTATSSLHSQVSYKLAVIGMNDCYCTYTFMPTAPSCDCSLIGTVSAATSSQNPIPYSGSPRYNTSVLASVQIGSSDTCEIGINYGSTSKPDWVGDVSFRNGSSQQTNIGTFEAAVEANPGGTPRSGTVTANLFVYNSQTQAEVICPISFDVYQAELPCSCSTLSFTGTNIPSGIMYEFDGSGVISGSSSFTFSFNECGEFDATFTSGSEHFEFGLYGSHQTPYVDTRGGRKEVTIVIKPKDVHLMHGEYWTGNLQIKIYDNKGNECSQYSKNVPIIQDEMPCDCKAIEYFVTSQKTTFLPSGYTGTVTLASGDTLGCGSISASSDSSIFVGRKVNVNYLDAASAQCTITADGITDNTGGMDRSTGVYLSVKDPEGVIHNCDKKLQIEQGSTACVCEGITLYTYARTVGCDSGSTGVSDWSVIAKMPNSKGCEFVIAESNQSWVRPYTYLQSYPSDNALICAEYDENLTRADRSATITIKTYVDCDGYTTTGGRYTGVEGGVYCSTTTVTFTQSACVDCTCNNLHGVDVTPYGVSSNDYYRYEVDVSGGTFSAEIGPSRYPDGCGKEGYGSYYFTNDYENLWDEEEVPWFSLSGFPSSRGGDYNIIVDPQYGSSPAREKTLRIRMYQSDGTYCDDGDVNIRQSGLTCSCDTEKVKFVDFTPGTQNIERVSPAAGTYILKYETDKACGFEPEATYKEHDTGSSWSSISVVSVSDGYEIRVSYNENSYSGKPSSYERFANIEVKLKYSEGGQEVCKVGDLILRQEGCSCYTFKEGLTPHSAVTVTCDQQEVLWEVENVSRPCIPYIQVLWSGSQPSWLHLSNAGAGAVIDDIFYISGYVDSYCDTFDISGRTAQLEVQAVYFDASGNPDVCSDKVELFVRQRGKGCLCTNYNLEVETNDPFPNTCYGENLDSYSYAYLELHSGTTISLGKLKNGLPDPGDSMQSCLSVSAYTDSPEYVNVEMNGDKIDVTITGAPSSNCTTVKVGARLYITQGGYTNYCNSGDYITFTLCRSYDCRCTCWFETDYTETNSSVPKTDTWTTIGHFDDAIPDGADGCLTFSGASTSSGIDVTVESDGTVKAKADSSAPSYASVDLYVISYQGDPPTATQCQVWHHYLDIG